LCSSSLCFLFLMLPSPSNFVAFLSRRCHLSVFLLPVAFPLFPLFFFAVSFSLLFCFPLLLFSFSLSVSSFFLFFPLCFLTFLCRSPLLCSTSSGFYSQRMKAFSLCCCRDGVTAGVRHGSRETCPP
jgi:hypothetical protein